MVGRYTTPAGSWEAVLFSHDGYPSGLGQLLLDEVRAWRGDLDGLLAELLDPSIDAPDGLKNAEFQTELEPDATDLLYRQDSEWVGDTNYLYLFDVEDRRLDIFDTSDYFKGKSPQAVHFSAVGIAGVAKLWDPIPRVVFAEVMDGWGDESEERKTERLRFANNVSRALGADIHAVAHELFALLEAVIQGTHWVSRCQPLAPHSEQWRPEWNPITLSTGWYQDGVYDLPIGDVVLHYGGSNTVRRLETSPHPSLIRADGALNKFSLAQVFAKWQDDPPVERYHEVLNVFGQGALEAILGPDACIEGVEWRLENNRWQMGVWQKVSQMPLPGQLAVVDARQYVSDAEEGDSLLRWETDVISHMGRWKWLVLDWMRMVARGETGIPIEEEE